MDNKIIYRKKRLACKNSEKLNFFEYNKLESVHFALFVTFPPSLDISFVPSLGEEKRHFKKEKKPYSLQLFSVFAP